jgi:hypothetical protein
MKAFPVLIATAVFSIPALAQDVGVSITIGEPGFYGRIDIGDAPQPRFVYPEPMFVVRPPSHVVMQPIYLRVPPGHARHWSKHCHEYNACNQPVYFVQDDWYSNVYAPYYHERHGQHDGGGGSPKGHGQGKRHDKD